MKPLSVVAGRSISLAVAVVLWEMLAQSVNTPLIPHVAEILAALLRLLSEFRTYENLGASIMLVASGFLLSVLLALPTGLIASRNITFARWFLPVHEFVRYIPVPAFVPLCAVVFGVGDLTKAVLIFIGTYFQLLFLFVADFSSVPKEFEDSGRTLGLSGLRLYSKIIFPASKSRILETIRITFAWSWSYLLVAEVVNSTRGIGFLVLQSYRFLRMDQLMALLMVIGAFGITADIAFSKLHRIICPWNTDTN